MQDIITRDEARTQGLTYYFSGVPCKRNHIHQRRTADTNCMACSEERRQYARQQKERARKFYAKLYAPERRVRERRHQAELAKVVYIPWGRSRPQTAKSRVIELGRLTSRKARLGRLDRQEYGRWWYLKNRAVLTIESS